MRNYDQMSDAEITEAVLLAEGWELLLTHHMGEDKKSRTFYHPDKPHEYRRIGDLPEDEVFNPCNNPSDAYPIMLENKIDFHFVNNKWSALSLERGYHEYSSFNPLRSVMIVFLMMRDSENV